MNIILISKYLVHLRKLNNYTQETLANELEISRQAISKWETGSSLPDLEMLLKLSKLYDKTINELIEPHIEEYITTFEEIISIDSLHLKSLLAAFDRKDIVKASMGASPKTNAFLKEVFSDIDFDRERNSIGSIRVDEIESIHSQIVSMINFVKISPK